MKFIAVIFFVLAIYLCGCIMRYGYGLEPISNGWVVWGTVGAILCYEISNKLGEDE